MSRLLIWTLLLLTLSAPATGAVLPSAEEIQRLGARMYREGILPDGQAMKAFVSNDVAVDGTAFTCVSCHLRSGLGSVEGEVVTPPTNGRILYQERKPYIKGKEFVPSVANYAKYLPVRPAYTDETLATLISAGVDPTGRSVLSVMPRYELEDRDMAILIAYLKTLSDRPSPGVGKQEIRFATVIVEGSDPVAVESMVTPLQFSVDRKNSLAKAAGVNERVARMGYNMLGDLHGYTFTLTRWILKGDPATWRAQLEEYDRKEPAFALLGGISPGTWEPVHRFCEERGIPDLFPVVDDPVLSDTDWYTHYLSRGVRQEGEAAARYLHGMVELIRDRAIVQVIRDGRRGRALADGFRTVWAETGHTPAVDIVLPAGEPLTAEALRQAVAGHKPAVLILWDDAGLINPLGELMADPSRPGMIVASATWLGSAATTVPEALRAPLFLTWPYRLPQDDKRYDIAARKVLAGKRPDKYDQVILRQSYITQDVLGRALMMMRGEFYRDFLLDTIGMMEDMYYPLYERVSFGPGQRYASKGCYIVQLGKGENPQFEKRSEWVIQ
ncbi:MAG: amino acid ABC transporter substrate-binding protein [Deltaproteobacteria bacterium]|nr:MAG: amino acid ABC transporter substrate-binding protein [Deltaproteobacteria bacterium]